MKLFSQSLVFAMVLLLLSCQDQEIQTHDPRGTAATTHLGLPGGPDQVFANIVVVNRNVTLVASETYILHNHFRVQPGYTLTIEPGTVIRCVTKGTTFDDYMSGTIIIERGARINAQGTAALPIVFTADAANPAPGAWGGIVILGKANVNLLGDRGWSKSSVNGLGFAPGLMPPFNTGRFGNGDNPSLPASGSYNTDDSGTMRYVRIEYAGGDSFNAEYSLSGLMLAGVGSGTTIDHVQVYKTLFDGFAFLGGTVKATHLVSTLVGDDDFYTDMGYSGKVQFGVGVRSQNAVYLGGVPLNGIESNGDKDDGIPGVPFTNAQFSNLTLIGPYQNGCGSVIHYNYRYGAMYRDLSSQDIFNSAIVGFPTGIFVSDERELAIADQFNISMALSSSMIDVRNTTIVVPPQNLIGGIETEATWDEDQLDVFDFRFLNNILAPMNNQILRGTSCIQANPQSMAGKAGLSPTAWDGDDGLMPDLTPVTGSPLLGSANFSALSGFTPVTYRGAFDTGTASNWMANWTRWN